VETFTLLQKLEKNVMPQKQFFLLLMFKVVLLNIFVETTVLNINNKKEWFFEHQISILELFLKDHVIMKIMRVMMLKIQLYNHRNKLLYSSLKILIISHTIFFQHY